MESRDLTENKNMNLSNILIQLLFDKWQMRGFFGFIIGLIPLLEVADALKFFSAFLGLILVALSVYKQFLEVKMKQIELKQQQLKLDEVA
jgi:hypothetical protein